MHFKTEKHFKKQHLTHVKKKSQPNSLNFLDNLNFLDEIHTILCLYFIK
jgi:hypothetical protein